MIPLPQGTCEVRKCKNSMEKGGNCLPCPDECLECDSKAKCLECQPSLILDNGKCIRSCPAGYSESSSKLCQKCHSDCKECFGPTEKDCKTCEQKVRFNATCVDTCPEGNYFCCCVT